VKRPRLLGRGVRLLAVALLTTTSCVPANAAHLSATVLDVGLVEPTGEQHRFENETSATGFVTLGDSAIRARTTAVPAIQGTAFGVRYRLDGLPSEGILRLTQVIRHPPMAKPDGAVIREQVSHQDIECKGNYLEAKLWYIMRERYEVVPGMWTLTVSQGDRVLVEQHFEVVAARQP